MITDSISQRYRWGFDKRKCKNNDNDNHNQTTNNNAWDLAAPAVFSSSSDSGTGGPSSDVKFDSCEADFIPANFNSAVFHRSRPTTPQK